MLATASEKGTLIRIYKLSLGELENIWIQINELRRGSEYA